MYPQPIQQASKATNIIYRFSLIFALVLWLTPLVAIFLTSMRSGDEVAKGEYWTKPENPLNFFSNISFVWNEGGSTSMAQYFANSLIIVIPSVFFALALAATAGYALSKFRIRGGIWWFAMFVAGNFVPFQILMIPVKQMTQTLGLTTEVTLWGGMHFNLTVLALILFHIAFQTGFCTLFMRNFISGLPSELIESARMDGMSEWVIFTRIILPLMRPALAALAVLEFTFIWNDYFWAITFIQDSSWKPITAGIADLKGGWLAQWHLISVASILAALPPVIMFFFLQKHFVAGLTMGATKG